MFDVANKKKCCGCVHRLDPLRVVDSDCRQKERLIVAEQTQLVVRKRREEQSRAKQCPFVRYAVVKARKRPSTALSW
jgi:hypothetical protein